MWLDCYHRRHHEIFLNPFHKPWLHYFFPCLKEMFAFDRFSSRHEHFSLLTPRCLSAARSRMSERGRICIFPATFMCYMLKFYFILQLCLFAELFPCSSCDCTSCKSPCCFLFSAPDGSSKHVILFENMDEELVTIGFVWWQLLNTQSAPPLDTSNISKMFTHLQGRSTPSYPGGSAPH